MKIIGITGGVGCGKSEVLAWIEKNYDAAVVRADDVGRDLMRPGTGCFRKITALFGNDCLCPDGTLNRPWIADRIFSDPEQRDALDAIIHPAVRLEIQRLILQNTACGWKYFFLESALLIEENYNEICDEMWYIHADAAVRAARLKEGRGYSEEKTRSVMRNQLPEHVFREKCQVVIDNSGSFAHTTAQIEARMAALEEA
ncbi:MAG: dephospho-CoA kinase [Eubacterium sp.]|nr:dephospho-CoA kinase [Eubacterium sp.]